MKKNFVKLNKMLLIILVFQISIIGANLTLPNDKSNGAPVKIFYGLNESHSNSWAKCTADGLIGITYFSRTSNDFSGNLIYKTIQTDGTEAIETVTSGVHLEISVLLFDENNSPHIFAASSNNQNQSVTHYFKNGTDWKNENIIDFQNEGGKFIYEMSADKGPDGSFHLIILKTRSNPDSDDYYRAYIDSHLYHLTNNTGNWTKELIKNYDTGYTLDEYSKMLNRQDIKIDKEGNVHVIYLEQINGENFSGSPCKLNYATNKTGQWISETAVNYNYGSRDSGGWYSSLCLDNYGMPFVSCCYIGRVPTGSAMFARLQIVNRINSNNWKTETVAEYDDGYYGRDGRDYTGGLTHLVFDKENIPHIIFTDIASSHGPSNYFNLGNIRHAVKNKDTWSISTLYRQPKPNSFFSAEEMYGLCLLIDKNSGNMQIVGQTINIQNEDSYNCTIIHLDISGTTGILNNTDIEIFKLKQNHPNPFNPSTIIDYEIKEKAFVSLEVFDVLGGKIADLVNEEKPAGSYQALFSSGNIPSGIYFYRLISGNYAETKKMSLVK